MRAILLILIIAVVALILAVMTGFIDLRQTQPAVAPGIETSNGKITTRGGQAPAFDVETGSIGVTTNGSVVVPKVEIQPGDTRIAVPSIEVRRPRDAPQAANAPQPAPAPAPAPQDKSAQ